MAFKLESELMLKRGLKPVFLDILQYTMVMQITWGFCSIQSYGTWNGFLMFKSAMLIVVKSYLTNSAW